MMKADKRAVFKFSPLQSEFAKANLKPEYIADLDSLVVLINGVSHRKALGVLLAVSELGGIWKLAGILRMLPESLLNFGYDLVAKNRYKIFGKTDTCRLPSPEEKSRFIL